MSELSAGGADPGLLRAVCLFLPLLAVVAAALRTPPPAPRVAAAILASAWNAAVLPAVNLVAVAAGWWSFHADGATAAGLPVDLMLGWILLWGTLPVLAAPRGRLVVIACGLAWLDLATMPFLAPVVRLGDGWLYGEALAVGAALVPGLLLGRWTETDRRLPIRALAQVALAGVLILAVPLAVVRPTAPAGAALGVTIQLMAVPLLLGVTAVREFAVRGRGTPLPYDPPRRLVTSGPYAYVRNPMQLSLALAYLLLAAVTREPRLLVAVAVVVSYSAGLAAWHEGDQLRRFYGEDWTRYRTAVRAWLPRWRPWPGSPPARVYVAGSCDVCDELGQWIRDRAPVALDVVPAEDHPAGLRRLTYESGDGRERAHGVVALACAFQHLNVGWAWLGWVLLLPGVARAVQFVVDGLGFGPRDLRAAGRAGPTECSPLPLRPSP